MKVHQEVKSNCWTRFVPRRIFCFCPAFAASPGQQTHFFSFPLSSSLSPPLPICHLQFPLHKSHCCGKHCQTVGMILSSQKVRKRAQEGGVEGRRCLTLSFGLFAINPTWSLCGDNNWSRSKLADIAKSSSKQAVYFFIEYELCQSGEHIS